MSTITHRMIKTNGINMRIAEAGEGPLVLMLHGWPESWYSWRHQLKALADAGYHAVAPDNRGYGGTDAPPNVEDYNLIELGKDTAGILDALGEKTAVLAGHDWGSMLTWHCALTHADRFTKIIGLSVPYNGRFPISPIAAMKAAFANNFFYILYFQEPGVAEAELEKDVRKTMRSVLSGISAITPGGGGTAALEVLPNTAKFLDQMKDPGESLPDWLTKEDLDYYTAEFERAGFRGGLNWYRNFDRNWEMTPELAGAQVQQPSIFITGEQDPVRRMSAEGGMSSTVKDLRKTVIVPGAGHWVQQEAPDVVNAEMLAFLKES